MEWTDRCTDDAIITPAQELPKIRPLPNSKLLLDDALSSKQNMQAYGDGLAHEIVYTYYSYEQQNAQIGLHICTDSPEPSMHAGIHKELLSMKAQVNTKVISPLGSCPCIIIEQLMQIC